MKNRVFLTLLAIVLTLSFALIGCGEEQSPVDVDAVVSECAGNLSVVKEDNSSWMEAEVGTVLEATDIIKCGDNSSAKITFLDGSTVELDPGTELKVIELSISKDTDSVIIRLKLIIGSIIFRVVNIIDPASIYEVETPTGGGAVRGSVMQVTVGEDGTTLICNLEGDIWAIAQGVELQIPEGECCVIRAGEPPELIVVVFPDPNLEVAIREAIGKPTEEGDIYPSDLEGLSSLDASRRNIVDVTGLEYCTDLTYLNLFINQISDISPLANLTNLTRVFLGYNQISDISAVANLTNLTVFEISSNGISDISAVANLTGLTYLHLFDNQISDISPIAGLTSLAGLMLLYNQISDISPLANLTNLTGFALSGHSIEDISDLIDLAKLTWLELSGSQISDISALAEYNGLPELYLYESQLSDISPLANFTNLTVLHLIDNQISDISPVSNLTSLEDLWLDGNQINDISPLASLTNLRLLSLGRNQIGDISALVDNEGLSEGDQVSLGANPLSEESINIYIPELEARGVVVSLDTWT